MSMNNTPDVETPEANDLEEFSASFFGREEAPKEDPVEEVTEEEVEDDATEEAQSEDDTLAEEPEDSEEEATPPPKKNRFQERIDEVTRERREAERRADAKEAELAEALRQLEELKKPPTDTPKAVQDTADTGPKANDTNEDGTDKYPLGEFDPGYIRDLMKHTLATERAQLEAIRKQEDAQKALEAELTAVQTAWNDKLAPAKERYPDFDEKSQGLLSTFDNIDSAYGEYLATTLMTMDYGPDVLYHLAMNPDEANRIVQSGPTKATIALGRLEARFASNGDTPTRPIKSSKAPPPPPTNKGLSAARSVTPDTDDLDAFSSLLFKK